MTVVWTALGSLLVALALRDIFDTLFHPAGRGALGRGIMDAVWALARAIARRRPGALVLAGPAAFIVVVATWTALLASGWALVLLPHFPEGYRFDPGLDPAEHGGFGDALYLSLVNLTSLGYGDIAPAATGLRIAGPVETIMGLGLVTASISWLVSIYTTLSRRRSFAHELFLAREAERRVGAPLAEADPGALERLISSFTAQLVAVRRDLIYFPISHYFRSEDEHHALPRLLPFLRRLAEEATGEGAPHALRTRGAMLELAIDDFAATLRSRLGVPGATTGEVLAAYAGEVERRPG